MRMSELIHCSFVFAPGLGFENKCTPLIFRLPYHLVFGFSFKYLLVGSTKCCIKLVIIWQVVMQSLCKKVPQGVHRDDMIRAAVETLADIGLGILL